MLTCFEEVGERFTYFTTKEHSCRKEFVDVHKVTFLGGVFTITSHRISLKKKKKNSYYFQSLPLGGILNFQANKEINNVGHRCRHFMFSFLIPLSKYVINPRDQIVNRTAPLRCPGQRSNSNVLLSLVQKTKLQWSKMTVIELSGRLNVHYKSHVLTFFQTQEVFYGCGVEM